jgi:adenylyl cyclase-associated protein
MDEALVGRLEAAVSRLEAINAKAQPSAVPHDLVDHASAAQDPAILAFDELVAGAIGSVSAAAGKIGAEVAEVTNVLEKAFLVGKDLLIRTKQTQVRLILFFSVVNPYSSITDDVISQEILDLSII